MVAVKKVVIEKEVMKLERKAVSGIMLTLLLTSCSLAFNIQPVKADLRTIFVPDNYPKIQAAVDAANSGDTIIVRDGTYTENVKVNKDHLIIKSESGADATIVQAADSNKPVFEVTTDYVSISGFSLKGARWAGVFLSDVKNCKISNNKASNNDLGIYLYGSSGNTILNNEVKLNIAGIDLWDSNGNAISSNEVKLNNANGIMLIDSNGNTISDNEVNSNNDVGIYLWNSNSNTISDNNVNQNYHGIDLRHSNNNRIYFNNFINNADNVYSYNSINIWNSPDEITYIYNGKTYTNYLGNYWSDYTGVDEKSGPNQDLPGSDGVGDTPYIIDADNRDRYPLMKPWTPMIKPVEGYLTPGAPEFCGYYYGGIHHEGIDIDPIIIDSDVVAAADGVVIYVKREITSWAGYWVWIWHGDVQMRDGTIVGKVSTRYLHLKDIPPEIKPDMKVYRGKTVLGKVGNSGSCWTNPKGEHAKFEPHLHFEVRVGDIQIGSPEYKKTTPVDPLKFVEYTTKLKTLSVSGYSPIDLMVVDPEGYIISKEVNELPETGRYWELPITDEEGIYDLITIDERKIGDYQIGVIPEPGALPTETYTLEIFANGISAVLAENVQIINIPSQPYIVRSTETEIIPINPATVDFDPATLNLKSKGEWVTVYIELPVGHGYDVSQIDVSSVRLNCTVPALAKPTEIGDYDGDGIPDLMVKFDGASVIALFAGKTVPGNYVMEVTGTVASIRFKGTDTIRVISPP